MEQAHEHLVLSSLYWAPVHRPSFSCKWPQQTRGLRRDHRVNRVVKPSITTAARFRRGRHRRNRCGLLIIAGYQTRVVASVLALFCLATAAFFHAHFNDPNQTFHFIKNLVMTGGLLQVVANGAGAISIDN